MANLFSWLRRRPASEEQSPTPAFEPRNELEVALIAAATEPGARQNFQKLLLESDLYVATPTAPQTSGHRTLKSEETFQILNAPGPNNEPLPALFTDESRLAAAFGAGRGFMLMPAKTLFEVIAESGAILNPGQAYGVMWSREEIYHMLGKPVRRTVKKDTQILLGSPANRPDALIRQISDAVKNEPMVEEVWLALAHWPDQAQSSWYLDVRSRADSDTVAPILNDVLRSGSFDGLVLDLVVNQPNTKPGIGIRIKPAALN